jgi:hypothetical protein
MDWPLIGEPQGHELVLKFPYDDAEGPFGQGLKLNINPLEPRGP